MALFQLGLQSGLNQCPPITGSSAQGDKTLRQKQNEPIHFKRRIISSESKWWIKLEMIVQRQQQFSPRITQAFKPSQLVDKPMSQSFFNT